MKSIILFIMVFVTANIFAQKNQLTNFNSLMESLKMGKDVKSIIHYGKCKLIIDGKEETAPDAIGGMEFKTFEYFAKGSVNNEKAFVTSSKTILISHPRYGYVYNYAKVKIYEDGNSQIIARYLDPKTLEVKMDETFFTEIANENKGALFLFE